MLRGLQVLSGEVGYREPHPRFYEAVVTACGAPAPHILFVGDHPEKDVLGPRRHGMIALRVARLGSPAPTASRVLGHLAGLPEFLASTAGGLGDSRPWPGVAEGATRGPSPVSSRPPPRWHWKPRSAPVLLRAAASAFAHTPSTGGTCADTPARPRRRP
ncbi:HAD family hydrolase [Yinghuangia aomiensis]